MGAYWSQQPNGKFCRFSTVVDTVTDWNVSLEQAINMSQGYLSGSTEIPQTVLNARKEKFITSLRPFDKIKEDFVPGNDSIEEFLDMLEDMGDAEGLSDEKLKEFDWLSQYDEN